MAVSVYVPLDNQLGQDNFQPIDKSTNMIPLIIPSTSSRDVQPVPVRSPNVGVQLSCYELNNPTRETFMHFLLVC